MKQAPRIRKRLRASDIARRSQVSWFTVILMVVAATLVIFFKVYVAEPDSEIAKQLFGDPDLVLPSGALDSIGAERPAGGLGPDGFAGGRGEAFPPYPTDERKR